MENSNKQFFVNLNDFFFVAHVPVCEDTLTAMGCSFFDSYYEMLDYVSETQGYLVEEIEGMEIELFENTYSTVGNEPVEIEGNVEEFAAQFNESFSE